MATAQLSASPITVSGRTLASFEGLRPSTVKLSSFGALKPGALTLTHRSFKGLVVKAVSTVAPKGLVWKCLWFTSIKPLGGRVLVKVKTAEEMTDGGVLLPTIGQSKPQEGEVVAVGERKATGDTKVDFPVKTGMQIIYSKYAGTEVEFNGEKYLILKQDDFVGILETDDIKDLKPLNDRVFLKVARAEEETGPLHLPEASKEKPSIGTVIAVGPGVGTDEEHVLVAPGNTVFFSKNAGNDLKGKDSFDYVALRVSDVMAVLS